eukprot:maker-scaffold_2-snap-gene-20.31-mRNA-1 protein AED:0.01 eAED:0.01 QI:126/1/1/1/1/1/3/768/354
MDTSAETIIKALFVGYIIYKAGSTLKVWTNPNHEFTQNRYSTISSFSARKTFVEDGEGSGSCVHKQPYIINKDGLYIFQRKWDQVASSALKGIVVICHGLNEHSLRYSHVAQKLNEAGYKVYSLDHQGHGMSEGTRLYVKKFSDFLDDVVVTYKKAQEENPGVKTYLLGHSMGGLIAILTTFEIQRQNLQLDGVIYSSPALAPEFSGTTGAIALGIMKMITGIVPKLRCYTPSSKTLTHDTLNRDKFFNDSLIYHDCGGLMTMGLSTELAQSIILAFTKVRLFDKNLPVLMIQGSDDGMVSPEQTRKFFQILENRGVKDATFKYYEGGYHELMNEPNWETAAVKDVVDWIVSKQ